MPLKLSMAWVTDGIIRFENTPAFPFDTYSVAAGSIGGIDPAMAGDQDDSGDGKPVAIAAGAIIVEHGGQRTRGTGHGRRGIDVPS